MACECSDVFLQWNCDGPVGGTTIPALIKRSKTGSTVCMCVYMATANLRSRSLQAKISIVATEQKQEQQSA